MTKQIITRDLKVGDIIVSPKANSYRIDRIVAWKVFLTGISRYATRQLEVFVNLMHHDGWKHEDWTPIHYRPRTMK